jgi:hypothetical protein
MECDSLSVMENERGEQLTIIAEARAAGCLLGGPHLARAADGPRGVPDHTGGLITLVAGRRFDEELRAQLRAGV